MTDTTYTNLTHEQIEKLMAKVSKNVDMDTDGAGLVLSASGSIVANFTYASQRQYNAAWFVISPFIVRQLLQEIKDLKAAQESEVTK